MSQIKEKVLNYFKTDRAFLSGIVLYQSLSGANLAFANQVTRMDDNPQSREHLHYELSKLAGMSQGELQSVLSKRIEAAKVISPVEEPAQDEDPVDTSDRFDKMEWNEIKAAAKKLPEEFQPEGKKKVDLLAALRAFDAAQAAEDQKQESEKKKASEQPPQE